LDPIKHTKTKSSRAFDRRVFWRYDPKSTTDAIGILCK
jgi:hypothetical protein